MISILKGRLIIVRLVLVASAALLTGIGILVIYAVGHPADPSPASSTAELAVFWKKQIIYALAGLAGFLFINIINYRRLGQLSYIIYFFVLGVLALLLVSRYITPLPFIPAINGTHRWIRITIAGKQLPAVQPSELFKIVYILALAWYLRYRSNYRSFSALIGPFMLTLIPMGLILLEPDLGTVMLMLPVFFAMIFAAGAKVKHLIIVLILAGLVSPLFWTKMNPYQRIRVSSVALQSEWLQKQAEEHPTLAQILVGGEFTSKKYRNTWGFHLIRSKYAIASGGFTGYGFRKGPFIKYNFLPARHNDFIFACVAHQFGFLGALGLLLLYIILIACGLEIAAQNSDPFGKLLATGITVMFAVEVLINVGMSIGLMPITGLTLPFVSYGGSSLTVSMLAIGILNNVGRCRPFSVGRKRSEEKSVR